VERDGDADQDDQPPVGPARRDVLEFSTFKYIIEWTILIPDLPSHTHMEGPYETYDQAVTSAEAQLADADNQQNIRWVLKALEIPKSLSYLNELISMDEP
jgi:hypothetical protein